VISAPGISENQNSLSDVTSNERAPLVSVIVFFREFQPYIHETLHSLERQTLFNEIEVLFPDGSPTGAPAELLERFPWLQRLSIQNGTMPVLKGRAIQAAKGDIIAILDPGAVAPADWIENIILGLKDEKVSAIGGAVIFYGGETAANKGAYLFEYSAFNPPVNAGPTKGDLAGNSVAYRRTALTEGCRDILAKEGFYKPFCHDQLRALGGQLMINSDIIIHHCTDYSFLPFSVRRGHYGRCFGASRLRHSTSKQRLLLRTFAPLVPLLLIYRNIAKTIQRPNNRKMLFQAWIPLIGICVFWGVGEWLGYWLGPGKSCEKYY